MSRDGPVLTVVLVLIEPFISVLREQFVLSERGVNEAVDEGRGQIHASGVHL